MTAAVQTDAATREESAAVSKKIRTQADELKKRIGKFKFKEFDEDSGGPPAANLAWSCAYPGIFFWAGAALQRINVIQISRWTISGRMSKALQKCQNPLETLKCIEVKFGIFYDLASYS